MSKSVELQDERAQAIGQARSLMERAEEAGRVLTPEEREQWDRHMDKAGELRERIKQAQWLEENPREGDEERHVWQANKDAESGPPASEEDALAKSQRAYRSALHTYFRQGNDAPPEVRALLRSGPMRRNADTGQIERRQQEVQDLGSGGFWVPDEMQARVEKALLFFGGMRESGAEILTSDSGADWPWPVYDDTANTGRRLAESGTVTQTDLSVGVRVLKAYMYSSDRILITYQLLQDAPLMSENLIADALGERIGRITNTEFTTYAGGDGPEGIIRRTTAGVTAAATGAVTSDELQRLVYSVPKAYRNERMRLMMHDNTYRDILQLKDGQGRYLFMPDPRTSPSDVRIWGVPVVINNDMPTLATTNITITAGDHFHYKIRDVRGFQVIRLNELYANNLQVGFIGFSRHDGGLIDAGQGPVRHLVMA